MTEEMLEELLEEILTEKPMIQRGAPRPQTEAQGEE